MTSRRSNKGVWNLGRPAPSPLASARVKAPFRKKARCALSSAPAKCANDATSAIGKRSPAAFFAEPDGGHLPPFILLAEPGLSATEQRACSEFWMRERLAASTVVRERLAFRFPATNEAPGKIKLGYLSNDFQNHATALLLIETL